MNEMKMWVMMVGIEIEIEIWVPSSCGDDSRTIMRKKGKEIHAKNEGRTFRKGKVDECVILCVNCVLGK